MLLELAVPQGQIASRWRGGENIVTEALEKAKGASHAGYLKVSLSKEGERSEGLISLSAGIPILCMYVFRPPGSEEMWFLGDKAARYLWFDSVQPEAAITLHGKVGLNDLEALFPQARVRRLGAPKDRPSADKLRQEKLRNADPGNISEHLMDTFRSAAVIVGEKADKQVLGIYDMVLQYHKMRSLGPEMSTCPECGGPTDLLGYCPQCASGEQTAMLPRMDPFYTFDNFVLSPGSRFAEAAARAVAGSPGETYNPLLVQGRSGLGKTHLLQAIGNQVRKGRPDANVLYLPLESLDEKQVESLSSRNGELRQGIERADVLLVDDLQSAAGRDRMQEELFRTISSLLSGGKQVVLTSDRPLREVPALSERLSSCLEPGLVVDLSPPDRRARVNILERMVIEEGLEIPQEVMGFVADRFSDNISQLGSEMDRVIAFASLMRSDITLELAREVLGSAEVPESGRLPELVEKRSYLVEESRPDRSYDLLLSMLDMGFRAQVFTRSNPSAVRTRLAGRKADVYWMTEYESRDERTVQPSLEKIVRLVEDHVRREGRSIVLLDDLHYLISTATFDGVIRFVRSLVDQVSERSAVFLLSISPESLNVQDKAVLERELEPIRP